MKRSKQEAAETRRHIVETAASEFRSHGIDGTGLIGLMAAAGLTHGGFYKHFESKEQVVEEALVYAVEGMTDTAERILSATPGHRGLRAVLSEYLSPAHRDDPAHGCAYAVLGCEIARTGKPVRDAMTAGLKKEINLLAHHLEGMSPAAAKRVATGMFATMVGAMMLSRVVTDPELSATILRESLKSLSPPA